MLLGTSFIPKDIKKLLNALNAPLIHFGINPIKRIIPLKIYATALKEFVTNICIIGTLMPTVLSRIVIPVKATSTVIHVFRICIKDIPDTLFNTFKKITTNIFPPIVKYLKLKTINLVFIIAFFNKLNQRNIFNSY